MKLNDILNESQVNELGTTPMGIGSRLVKGAMAKLGSGKAEAELDVGKRANILEKTFSAWARRSGLRLDRVSISEVDDFLNINGLPPVNHNRIKFYDLTDSDMTRLLWTKVAQASYRAGGSDMGLGGRFNVPMASGGASTPPSGGSSSGPGSPTGSPTGSPPKPLTVPQLARMAKGFSKNQLGNLIARLQQELANRP
jgi:ribosomal protein L20A (L18A)